MEEERRKREEEKRNKTDRRGIWDDEGDQDKKQTL